MQPRRRRRLGRQLQRPGPGRDRRIARRRRERPASTPRSSAPSRSWRCRSPARSTPRSWRPPATGSATRSPPPTSATPRSPSCRTSTPSRTIAATSGSRCSRPSSPARSVGSTASRRCPALGVTDFAELGPGGVLTGMAKRSVDGARTISVATPEDLDKLLDWMGGRRPSAPPSSRASTCSPPSGSSCRPRAGIFTPVADPAGQRHRGGYGDRSRRRARGPLAVPRGAAELHRRRHRTRDVTTTHRLAAHQLTKRGGPHASDPTRLKRCRHLGVGHRPAREGRHQRRVGRHDGHERRVDPFPDRDRGATHRRQHDRPVGRVGPSGARDGRPRPEPHRRARARHHDARQAVGQRRPRSSTSSACAAVRSTSTPRAPDSCTGWSPATD